MKRQIIEIRVKKKGDGVVVSGVTRTDRGTKYLTGSLVLNYEGLDKKGRDAKMKAAIEEILAARELSF